MKLTSIVLLCCFLAVSYAADMITTNADDTDGMIVLQSTDDLVLQCKVTSGGTDGPVSWTKSTAGSEPEPVTKPDDSRIVDSKTGNLTIKKPTEMDAGNYTCKIEIGGTVHSETIHVVTNVTVRMKGKSINKQEGDDLTVTCRAYGKPTPTVTWTKDGQDIFRITNASHRLELSTNDDGVPEAELKLASLVRHDDAGDYCCRAQNMANAAEECIIIRVKDKYAALWPFIGIVAEVILLTAIIYIYEKKKSKPDMDDSDTDHANDRPEPKGDVRQRK